MSFPRTNAAFFSDEEEQDSPYRECAIRLLGKLNVGLAHIFESKDAKRAAREFGLAIGSNLCRGMTVDDIAKEFNVTKQCISQNVKRLQRSAALPTSPYQKSEEAVRAARIARERVLSGKKFGQSPKEL